MYSHAAAIAAILMRERELMHIMTPSVPPIDPAFISEALELEPKPGAEEIAELWVDQHATEQMTTEQFQRAVAHIAKQAEYYI